MTRPRVKLLEDPPKLSEAMIARAVVHSQLFQRKIIVIPGCHAAGHEADLLAVEPGGRLIEIEIKTSRADLLADLKKEKWVKRGPWIHAQQRYFEASRLDWPGNVWKHYYLVPAEILRRDPELASRLPPKSGILGYSATGGTYKGWPLIDISPVRRVQTNRAAKPLSSFDILNMARLANLRMWDALMATSVK